VAVETGKAHVSFAIAGSNQSEDQLNTALGRKCDAYHCAGDKIGNSSLTHPEDEWIVNGSVVDADSAEDAVESLVAELSSLTAKINTLEDVTVTLSVEINSDEKIGLYLDPDVVGVLTLMGAALDITVTAG